MSACKCSMAISVNGDGCRYCQPQEYIDRLIEWLEESRAQFPSQGGEAVEVVAYGASNGLDPVLPRHRISSSGQPCSIYDTPLMTVAQHQRIVAALTTPPSPDADHFRDPAQMVDAELVELKALLPELDDALEDLELHGRHSDQGYRKLKDWYRKMALATDHIDTKLASLKGEL